MKNLKNYILLALAVVCLGLTSCSKKSKTLEYIPGDADIVAGINAVALLENAGCENAGSTVKIAGPLAKLFNMGGSETALMRKFIESESVDLTGVFVIGSFTGDAYIMASLSDAGKFESFLKEQNLRVEHSGGFNYVRTGDYSPLIAWNDNIVVSPVSSYKDADKQIIGINDLLDRAEKGSLADAGWKADLFAEENAAGFFVACQNLPAIVRTQMQREGGEAIAKLLEGNFCGTLRLDNAKAELIAGIRDKDGKAVSVEGYGNYNKAIDPAMLKYLNNYDVAMLASGIKGDTPWRELLGALGKIYGDQTLGVVYPYLEAIDGTVMIGAGPTQGIQSFSCNASNVSTYWDFVCAVQLKPGKAQLFTDGIRTLMQTLNPNGTEYEYSEEENTFVASEIPMSSCEPYEGNGLKIKIPDGPMVYVKPDGNNLVLATREFTDKGGTPIKADMFSGKNNAVVMYLPKNSPILTEMNLNFGLKLSMLPKDTEMSMTLEVEDSDKPLLETLLSSVL